MQEADIDTIKFCVSLINRLKKQEIIDVRNKMIKAGLESIKNDGLKLLIQAQSCNDNSQNRQALELIQRKTQFMGRDSQTNRQECLSNRMLKLKVKALILMKTMRQNQVSLSLLHAREITKIMANIKEMKFVLELLFKIGSLHQLQILNVLKTNISHLTVQQQEIFLYIVALVKLESRKDEAQDILVNQLKNKYKKADIEKQKKAVLSVIKVLLQKQRQLLKEQKPQLLAEDNSRFLYCQSTRKIIKNKFFFQYKIDLDLSMAECQKKVSSLDQRTYLLASPLFNFYFQNNQEIVQKLALTQIHKKISIAKSVLIQSLQLNSTNGKNKTKFKFRYARNPQKYRKYINQTASNNHKYEERCAQGEFFVKYNYNNLYSAFKFVTFTRELLSWGKNKVQIQKKSTKIKTSKVLGLIYGKITERLQEQSEIGPCFSFLLKDRTVDLAMPKQQIKELHRFILGANSIISSYHSQEAQKIKQQGQTLSDLSEIEDNNSKISFHQSKNQQITKGKLLWRDLFISMASKSKRFGKQLFPKVKSIIYGANKEALSNSKLSLRNKLSLDHSKVSMKQMLNKGGS